MNTQKPQTLYDKLWNDHVVRTENDGTALLYIDRHLVHEVTSPQAFEGLQIAKRILWRKNSIVATADHNVPTTNCPNSLNDVDDKVSKLQIATLDKNIKEFGALAYYPFQDKRQGIVHVVGPENGATLPGMTVVCGDSHTSTHGALACLAHGIGTSEVEHVMATQCLLQKKSKTMQIRVEGTLQKGVTAKDIILAIIGKIGTAGGTGYAIEFAGSAIRALSVEGRMSICNMSIEAGARVGFVAFDDKTLEYLQQKRPLLPSGEDFDKALEYWKTLHSDDGAVFDKEVVLKAEEIDPQVSWGTSPEMVVGVNDVVPNPDDEPNEVKSEGMRRALKYMDLSAGKKITDIFVDKIFIGSCTNSRIEDLRAAAEIIQKITAKNNINKIAENIKLALIVPGSGSVKAQAEAEGLDKIFINAGFQWREPGCSMCLAMNADRLESGERCASTSNRNFEGRQGAGGRTHLVSPQMAAAAAMFGHFVDIRKII